MSVPLALAVGDRVRTKGGPCFGKVTVTGILMAQIRWLCHPGDATRISVWPVDDLEHID